MKKSDEEIPMSTQEASLTLEALPLPEASPGKRWKTRVQTFLKLAFVAVLLAFLVKKGFISGEHLKRAFQSPERMIPAIAALVATTAAGALRWKWLLDAQGIQLSFKRVLQLHLIGNFFNLALPGAVSGDFVKAFYVGKEVQGQRARAFGSILFDRVSGLAALVIVSAGAILLGLRGFLHTPFLHAIQTFVLLAAAAFLAFFTYLFLVKETHDPLLLVLQKVETRIPKVESLRKIYESLRHYHHHRKAVILSVGISVLVHLIVGWACFQFAQALGDTELPLLRTYVVVPIGLLVTAIPVAPGGIGTGNVAFLWLFQLIGSQRGADVYSLFALTNLIFGSVGGWVYLRFKQAKRH